MYLKTPNSTKYVIQDEYTCWIPTPSDTSLIQNYDLPRSKQIWKRTPLPSFWEERRQEEIYHQQREQSLVDDGKMLFVTHVDPLLEDFRREQWRRRIYGHYVMIDGELVYLTPGWYQYLNWSKIDIDYNDGYPMFYFAQRDRFYHRRLCWEDPYSLGYIHVGSRGYGKTSEEAAEMLHNMTMPPHNKKATIQSKSETDAKEAVFQQKMVLMFNSYPDFFKPTYSHGSDPKDKMVFKRPSKMGAESKLMKFGPEYELGNSIFVKSAKEKACDGMTLSDAIQDEIGKTHPTKEADVYKRIKVLVKCVFRNERKTGIIRGTTTVEEMEEGGSQCHEIYMESDPSTRDENGQTTSKLYALFISAIETSTRFADKFGRIDEEKAKIFLLNERKPLEGDPYKLSMEIRKKPLTVSEAFMTDQNKCLFNVFILTKKEGDLKALIEKPYRPGRLEWVNGKDGEVQWFDDVNGPFRQYIAVDDLQGFLPNGSTRKIYNSCIKKFDSLLQKSLWTPVNDDLFGCGADPIKYAKTDDPRASKLAAYGFLKYNENIDDAGNVGEWTSHNIAWRYFHRSDNPNDDYENIIKAIRFWGHSVMPENNVTTLNKHLYDRGYQKFIITRGDFDFSQLKDNKKLTKKQKEEAVSTTPEVINKYVDLIRVFVILHGHRINDLELVKQLLTFDVKKPTKFDLVLALGYTLMSLSKKGKEISDENLAEEVLSHFRLYDQNGDRSTVLEEDEEDNYLMYGS